MYSEHGVSHGGACVYAYNGALSLKRPPNRRSVPDRQADGMAREPSAGATFQGCISGFGSVA